MAAFEVIALDTATPQLRAPGASDTYTFPRAVEMPLGTANGVLYLDGSKVVTSGSALTFDGSTLATTGALTVSGTAGDPISFTQAMTLDASGNLLMGSTSASVKRSGVETLRLMVGSATPGPNQCKWWWHIHV
jgi:hypothetical protein